MAHTDLDVINLTKEQFAARWRDPIDGGFLSIKTKDMRLIALVSNPHQGDLMDRIEAIQAENRPVRLLIPKARRLGVSTIVEAIFFSIAAFRHNVNVAIMADIAEHSTNIFEMSKLMYEMMNPCIRPKKKKSNAKQLSFAEMHSQIDIGTAETKTAFRSGTYHLFHGSEVAFFGSGEKVMLGVMQTVDEIPGTMIILESTGNGISGYFYEMCMQSLAGENDYEIFFIPWHEAREYRMKLAPGEKIVPQENGKYGNEIYYIKKYNLDLEQVKWRRHIIKNKCNGNLKQFMQEYPADLMECFQASGVQVFDIMKLMQIQLHFCHVARERYIMMLYKEVRFVRKAKEGYIQIWKEPVPGWDNRYCIFADTGGTSEKADYDSAHCYDRVDKEYVAAIHGHFNPIDYAFMLVYLGKKYEHASVAIESNKLESETDEKGVSVLRRIMKIIEYDNIYMRRVWDEIKRDFVFKYGFFMGREEKQLIVTKLMDIIEYHEANEIVFNDKMIIEECKTYVENESDSGKKVWGAQEGAHDDRVISAGGCLVMDDILPAPSLKKRVVKIPERRKVKKNKDEAFIL